MADRRVGIWFVGAFGGVATTVSLGLAALRRKLIDDTGLTTALPDFQHLHLDPAGAFVVGGHDIRRASFLKTARELQQRSSIFPTEMLQACAGDLESWSANVRPGTILNVGETIANLAELPEAQVAESPRAAMQRIQADLQAFQKNQRLDQLVVINAASTEPPFKLDETHNHWSRLEPALAKNGADLLPASSLYALAAIDLGLPYINFTPSLGASFPAALQLVEARRTVTCGQDGKTGETLLKTVIAPMFALRNLRVLSWVGHNIFGNRDGLVLDDPRNKESKVRTKDQVIEQIVGYRPKTHVSIEYIESMDDWKTAWDHVHFQGFLGVKMAMQFTWQGCDSILAAPLVIDLARLTLFAHRRGEVGILRHLACFFKNPMGVVEHDFFKQFHMLGEYAARVQQ